jgi:hypothetical protein
VKRAAPILWFSRDEPLLLRGRSPVSRQCFRRDLALHYMPSLARPLQWYASLGLDVFELSVSAEGSVSLPTRRRRIRWSLEAGLRFRWLEKGAVFQIGVPTSILWFSIHVPVRLRRSASMIHDPPAVSGSGSGLSVRPPGSIETARATISRPASPTVSLGHCWNTKRARKKHQMAKAALATAALGPVQIRKIRPAHERYDSYHHQRAAGGDAEKCTSRDQARPR